MNAGEEVARRAANVIVPEVSVFLLFFTEHDFVA